MLLGEYIKAFLTKKSNNGFFLNRDYLEEAKRKDLPGHTYVKKIWDFYNADYNTGELFMEYLKKGYISKDGRLCAFCQAHDWVGPSQERIPVSQFQIPITLVTI